MVQARTDIIPKRNRHQFSNTKMDTQHEQYGRENEITEATWASLSAVFGDSQLRQVFGSPSGHPTTTPPENFEFTDPESEFFECIYREDTEKLARLLSRRKCLTSINTIIKEALDKHSYSCVSVLARHERSQRELVRNFKTVNDKPILLWAVLSRDFCLVQALVEAGVDMDAVSTLSGGPKTALHAAITLKMQGTSRYLIMNLRKLSQRKDRGVNKNFWPERTTHYSPSWPRRVETVLPTAIRLAQSETTSLLLENGADPSTTDAAGVDMMSLCYDSACSDTSANVSKYANIATELLKYGWGKCSITNGAPFSVSAREVLDKILEEIEEPNFGSESNSRRPALADISNQPDQQTKRRKIDTEKTCTHGWAKFKKEVSKEYAWQRRKALLFARMKNRHR